MHITAPHDAGAPDLGTLVGASLPYLRRYAHALTGNQDTGDRHAAATLEAPPEDASVLDGGMVMIIQHQAIIAMDIRATVTGMGHTVTGLARTRSASASAAARRRSRS